MSRPALSVRWRLALTVFFTGLATAVGVIVTVLLAFQRFEHESTWQRADAFLARVTAQHGDLFDLHQRNPEEFAVFLRNLVLYDPENRLYLLDAEGVVLVSTGRRVLPPGFKVSLPAVRQAAEAAAAGDRRRAAYVMGDDPEYMALDAVIAARALNRAVIRPSQSPAGYLYLVCRKEGLPAGQLDLLRTSLASPALLPVLAVVLLATALAAWIIAAVTRPLQVLSDEVAGVAQAGFTHAATVPLPAQGGADDEIGRLRRGFHALLATLRMQWDELRRLDTFRRESVSNLSHDLRSPLTATVACLETLQRRWDGDAARADDQALVQVALRNSRNAAQLVRSLGDLALLDEPQFRLQPMTLDLAEALDDIVMRFADRAGGQGVTLHHDADPEAQAIAAVDVELFERAVANLVDNALKFTPAGGRITLRAEADETRVRVRVADTGRGIAPADLEHLFDRLYTAGGEGGRGLGLAIVKRIAELHHGDVTVRSAPNQGTEAVITLPRA